MILSISDIEKARKNLQKTGFIYLLLAVICAFAGAIYEIFSHGVFSYYMLYAFGFPLAGGALPFLAAGCFGRRDFGRTALRAYHAGIGTLTTGSFVQGILEIYGTTNKLVFVYWVLGGVLLTGGIFMGYLTKGRNICN